MNRKQGLICILIASLVLIPMIGSKPAPASAADFDKDGYADLAIGVRWETFGSQERAGAVNVLYGTAGGVSAYEDQIWEHGDLYFLGTEGIDYFGETLAAGDFDGNGAFDLAVGIPLEDHNGILDCGAVQVVYGSQRGGGLGAAGTQFWYQGTSGVGDDPEESDLFGSALAVGDFDGDGYDDLAVGVPYEDIGEGIGIESDAGAVNVIYGSADGLTSSGSQLWFEEHNGLPGGAEVGDWFGFALAAGDFDGDGRDDLAIGISGEDLEGIDDAGRVVILYGTSQGLTATGSQSWQQGLDGVGDQAEEMDRFGRTLTTGDFDGDHYADLAIGVPGEELVGQDDAGQVHVLYGSSDGLTATGTELFNLETYYEDELYGKALTAGDFNGDGYDDLAVGFPGEDLYSWADIGAVEILYGTSSGLHRRPGEDDIWSQNVPGMEDGPEPGDNFGFALAAADFDGDGYADLAVGIPEEDIGLTYQAGAVAILYGTADGITVANNQFWHQDSPWVEDDAEEWDSFGYSLAAVAVTQPPPMNTVFLPLIANND